MGNSDDFIKIYSSARENGEKSNRKTSGKLKNYKNINSIMSLIFMVLWIITSVISTKRNYDSYYIYLIIIILLPLVFILGNNVNISNKLKGLHKEVIRMILKCFLITAMLIQVIRPAVWSSIGVTRIFNNNSSSPVNTSIKGDINLNKSYNILIARVNDHDFSNYWRNSILNQGYDNSKIVNSLEIVTFNKNTLEISTRVIPLKLQVKYYTKDYADELMYAYRVGGEENLVESVKENLGIKLDYAIILNNSQVDELLRKYITNLSIQFSEEGISGSNKKQGFNIASIYNESGEDEETRYSLIETFLLNLYSLDKDNFINFRSDLLRMIGKNKIDFLDETYSAYSNLIINKRAIINKKVELKTTEIDFKKLLQDNNLQSSDTNLNTYKLKVIKKELVDQNIFLKELRKKTNQSNTHTNNTQNNTQHNNTTNNTTNNNTQNNAGNNTNTNNNTNGNSSNNNSNTNGNNGGNNTGNQPNNGGSGNNGENSNNDGDTQVENPEVELPPSNETPAGNDKPTEDIDNGQVSTR